MTAVEAYSFVSTSGRVRVALDLSFKAANAVAAALSNLDRSSEDPYVSRAVQVFDHIVAVLDHEDRNDDMEASPEDYEPRFLGEIRSTR